MSRSMTPPSTLTDDDRRKVADLRRDIWTNAFYGMGVGSCTGVLLHSLASYGNRRNYWKLATNRNTLMASILVGASAGSFLLAKTAGTNGVHTIHDVFERGARPPPSSSSSSTSSSSSYADSLQRAKQRETDLRTLERRRTLAGSVGPPSLSITAVVVNNNSNNDDAVIADESVERVQRERNRLFRRASLSRQLEEGHGGLSDSHGGRWVKEDGMDDDRRRE